MGIRDIARETPSIPSKDGGSGEASGSDGGLGGINRRCGGDAVANPGAGAPVAPVTTGTDEDRPPLPANLYVRIRPFPPRFMWYRGPFPLGSRIEISGDVSYDGWGWPETGVYHHVTEELLDRLEEAALAARDAEQLHRIVESWREVDALRGV